MKEVSAWSYGSSAIASPAACSGSSSATGKASRLAGRTIWSAVKNAISSRGDLRCWRPGLGHADHKRSEQERQKAGQSGEEKTVIAAEMTVLVHVINDRLDAGTPPNLRSGAGLNSVILPGDEDALLFDVVAAVAAVDIGVLDRQGGDTLGLSDLRGQRMALRRDCLAGLGRRSRTARLAPGA